MTDKIWYEPHPVSQERKKELRAKGFKIIDAKFKPKETEKPAGETAEVVEKPKRKPRSK